MKKTYIKFIITILIIPFLLFAGIFFFNDRSYLAISFLIVFFSLIPVWLHFERKSTTTRELIILAVLTAISVTGRYIFAAIPGFKPVTAITTISGIYFGPEAGFLVGSLSALVSNIFFMQGPWTPFQMFSWGLIGFISGLLQKTLLDNKVALSFFGIFAGTLYSFLMDIWTVLSIDGTFNLNRYLAALISAIPFTLTYAISNVIFLLVLTKPIGRRLERIKKKYL